MQPITIEGQFTSVSSVNENLSETLLSAVAPIKLPDEKKKAYEDVFFSIKAAKNSPFSNDALRFVATESLQLGSDLNNFFAFIRRLISYGALYDDKPLEQLETEVQRLSETIKSNNTGVTKEVGIQFLHAMRLMDSVDNAELKSNPFRNVDISARPSVTPIIKPSNRYKGGFDIIYAGRHGRGGMKISMSPFPSFQSNDPKSTSYANMKMSSYSTDLSLKAIAAAKRILELVTIRSDHGKFTVETANKRRFCQFPLDYAFATWNDEISKIMGMRLEFFKNLDAKVRPYKDFFSAVVVIETPDNLVYPWDSHIKHTRKTKNNQFSAYPVDRPNNADHLIEESMYTPQVGSSLSINLEPDFVKYISQDESLDQPYYCLNAWATQWTSSFLRPANSRTGGNAIDAKKVARYIVRPSRLNSMSETRKKLGLHVSGSKANDDGLVVMPNGSIGFMPVPEDASNSNAVDFEKRQEDYLSTIYQLGLTPGQNIHPAVVANNPDDERLTNEPAEGEFLRTKRAAVSVYGGALLAYNWDYNTYLYAPAEVVTSGLQTKALNGCTSLDPLMIADFLGYDFKSSGQSSQSKHFLAAFTEFRFNFESVDSMSSDDVLSSLDRLNPRLGLPDSLVKHGDIGSVPLYIRLFLTRRMLHLFEAYSYFAGQGKIKGINQLIDDTKAEMKISMFSREESPLDYDLYSGMLSDSISLGSLADRYPKGNGLLVLALLLPVLKDSQGYPRSNLYRLLSEEVGFENAAVEVKEHGAYFNLSDKKTRMADFGNVYNYFGGRLFKNMCKALASIPKKELIYPERVIDPDDRERRPVSFDFLAADVLPLAVIFSKYVPEYLDYFEQAEEIYEKYTADETIDVEDIVAPGIALNKNGTKPSLFPHQVKANRFLRRAPKFAILDISPGGGKTTIGIIDILCLAEKHKADGFMPIVVAPDRLCGNWCEDTAKFTKGNWNTIPLTRAVMKVWGYDLMYKIIKEAPRNTILVVGLNFLSRQNKFSISYGSRDVTINGSVEFLKQFNPSYVLLDESHKAKNASSQTHQAIKELTTMTGLKYIRLATGTLVHGVLTDVVGQSALLSSYALKTADAMDKSLADLPPEKLPGAIRNKLGKYCSLVTMKRKEWAFMLPNPIDSFLTVRLFDEEQTSLGINKLGNRLHQEAYEHVMSEAKEILMSGRIGDLKKEGDDDEIGDSDDAPVFGDNEDDAEQKDDDDDKGEDGIIGKDGEISTSIMAILDATYLQRAEQMIVNPWGDNYFQQIAEQAGLKKGDFTPAPIAKTIQSVREHFEVVDRDETKDQTGLVYKWKPDILVREFDVVEYKGEFYMRRPLPVVEGEEASIKRRETPRSKLTPDQDNETWKPENRGKILILCRYIGNTQAIYDALPTQYRSKARIFHGKIKKDVAEDNIEQFKYADDVQILIANEQAIAEGLNLQMASRIIRVDTPWSPGEYEQSTARIFRPDPAAAKRGADGKVGDIAREVIYIDWIMCEGTMQVGKVARLMWKTVDGVRFNEEGNAHYDPMKDYPLEKIVMGMDLLFERCYMEDYRGQGYGDPNRQPPYVNDYFGAKAVLATLERQEFMKMRVTTKPEMIDMVVPELPKDFRRLELLPTMPNQIIPDPDDFGLLKLPSFIKQNLQAAVDDPMALLKGLPVKTGFGTGTIVGIQRSNRIPDPETGELQVNEKKPVVSVIIKYHSSNKALADIPAVNMPIEMVYVATNIDGKRADQFFRPTEMSAADRKKMEKAAKEAERIAEENRIREEKQRRTQDRKDREDAERKNRTEQRVRIRQDNIRDNKPVNDGVEVVQKLPKIKPEVSVIKPDQRPPRIQPSVIPTKTGKTIKLIPTFYDGFLCIHATNNHPEASKMKKFGFENFEDFIYMDFENFYKFEGLLRWLVKQEKLGNIEMDDESFQRLDDIQAAFDREHINPEQWFNYKQAKKAQSKAEQFFRSFKRTTKSRKLVRIYPIVMHDRLRVAIDMKTNPVAAQLKGKLISAVGEKWRVHPGMHIYFAGGKRELVQKLKELEEKGYTIENRQSLIEAIDDLRLK